MLEVAFAIVAAALRTSFWFLEGSIRTMQVACTSMEHSLSVSLSIMQAEAGIVDGSEIPTRYAARDPISVIAITLFVT